MTLTNIAAPVPAVGNIVHYTNLGDADGKYPPEQQAAIITKVVKTEERTIVSLKVFYETGDFFMKDVPFSPAYKRGYWSWALTI